MKRLQDEGLDEIVIVDSAGTHAYHVGQSPDNRAQQAARKRGIEIEHIRARRTVTEDFLEFDYVLAMDRDNLFGLEAMRPSEAKSQPHLFLSYASELDDEEVPDPYYGGATGFERVLDMIEAAADGLLQDIRNRYL